MKWEELKTPEAVLAAFEAGRRVQASLQGGAWLDTEPYLCVTASMAADVRYRALIEEPADFTPRGGNECPANAWGQATTVLTRDGSVFRCDRGQG